MEKVQTIAPGWPEIAALKAQAGCHHSTLKERRTLWQVWGPAHGEPVVLLHGGSGSWTHWLRNIEPLVEAGRQVWVPDLPGCGDSDRPAQGEDARALVPHVIDGLQTLMPGRAFDLVGFSFGGMVAGLVAEHAPAGLRRLVLVGAPVIPLPKRSVPLREWRHLSDPAAREAVHRGNLAAIMLHRPESITAMVLQLHADNLARDRLRRRHMQPADPLAWALARVPCPIYALYGEEDAFYRLLLEPMMTTLDALPNLVWRHGLAGAGHWVQFEEHEAFNRALARALADPVDCR